MNDTFRQWKRDTFWYLIGFITGAGVMIYVNSLVVPVQAKPSVTVEHTEHGCPVYQTCATPRSAPRDAAPPLAQVEAEKARHLQRAQELRFSLAKLERLQQDRFAEAVANRDSIREMVAKLGEVGK